MALSRCFHPSVSYRTAAQEHHFPYRLPSSTLRAHLSSREPRGSQLGVRRPRSSAGSVSLLPRVLFVSRGLTTELMCCMFCID